MANVGKTASSKYIKSTNYSNKSRFVSDTASVQKVTNIQSANNDHLKSSNNQLFNFDHFYEILQSLKQEYKDYFKNKKDFDDNLRVFKKHKRKIMIELENLIRAYNKVMESLDKFDIAYRTNYINDVERKIDESRQLLKNAGIDIHGQYTLMLNRSEFNKIFSDDLDNLEPLIAVEKGFFEQIFKILYKVKVNKAFSEKSLSENAYTGKILDLKG